MLVIGVSGKAGSGKDTIGNRLIKKHGFKRIALADPIRRIVQDVFVLDWKTVLDRELREKPLKDWPDWNVRMLLQVIGTNCFRKSIDPAVWVKSLILRIKKHSQTNWVVTDVRFPNERNILKKAFGKNFIMIRVEREGHDGKTVGGIANHESEAYTIEADAVLQNDGTKRDLYKLVDDIFVKTKTKKQKRGKS